MDHLPPYGILSDGGNLLDRIPDPPTPPAPTSSTEEPSHQHALYRRIFREMVIAETEKGALSGAKRRELVQFAGRMHLSPNEARLLIRAVEFERGLVPIEEVHKLMHGATKQRRWSPTDVDAAMRIGLAMLIVLLNVFVFRWILRMFF